MNCYCLTLPTALHTTVNPIRHRFGSAGPLNQASYNLWLVALSILVAMVVSYTALRLAARVAEAGRGGGRLWLLGGAAAMGMGIWSMHFIGMLAFSVAIPLRYGIVKTLVSLAIAMVTSGFALAIASPAAAPEDAWRRLGREGTASAPCTTPAWPRSRSSDDRLELLLVALRSRSRSARHSRRSGSHSICAARIESIGLARSVAAAEWTRDQGMHYTRGPLPSSQPARTGVGGASFDNGWLAAMIGIVSRGVLILTLIMTCTTLTWPRSTPDAKRWNRARSAHARQNLLALATRAAHSSWKWTSPRKRHCDENEIESLRIAGVDTRTESRRNLGTVHPDDRFHPLRRGAQGRGGRPRRVRFRFRVVAPGGAIVHLNARSILLRRAWRAAADSRRLLGHHRAVLQEERRRELQTAVREASREAGMAESPPAVLHTSQRAQQSGVSASLGSRSCATPAWAP